MGFHQQYPGVFLELGVGANDFSPMPTPLVGIDEKITSFDFSGDNSYVGIDTPTQSERYWRGIHQWFLGGDTEIDENSRAEPEVILSQFEAVKAVVLSYRPNDNIDFILADAEQLPFEDESIAEVYMANVAGSQMKDEHLAAILSEAKRVIGHLGRLTIRENHTPHWMPDDMDEIIRESGFVGSVAKYKRGSREYDTLVEQYGLHPLDLEEHVNPLSENNMFMVATVG